MKRAYSLYRKLLYAMYYVEMDGEKNQTAFIKDIWFESTQVMAARERENPSEGFYLAAKGGHNGESHNHNDVGQFIVYSDGCPFIIDIGVEAYTAKTFSCDRYDIWTMQSAYHNLPQVNGIQQQAGAEHKAEDVVYQVDNKETVLTMNIAAAYPAAAGIHYWHRAFRLNRENNAYIEISDDFELENATEEMVFCLVTPCQHEINPEGSIILDCMGAKRVRIEFDADKMNATTERLAVMDERLAEAWGDHIYRLVFKVNRPIKNDSIKMKILREGFM